MLNSNYIQSLFGIKDVIVIKITSEPNKPYVNIFFMLKRDIHECPRCKALSDTVHDYRTQIIKGPPLGEKFILFPYRKRRYRCPSCGKRFYEKIL